jgi:D-3-phosphoglycerate dehydrogenase
MTCGVRKLRIEYLGEISNHEIAPIRAGVIVGMLERISTAKVTIVNAEQLAEEHGLRIEEEKGVAPAPYANLVVVHAVTEAGETSVAATHTPTGERIVGIGDFDVEIVPRTDHLLAIENIDRPGMIGAVGQVVGGFGVNISSMSVAAGPEGTALMVLSVDGALTPEQVAEIEALEQIHRARQVDLS